MDRTEEDGELLQQILSSFLCIQDRDIEAFLHSRAVNFERLLKARTYLVLDEDELIGGERPKIYGYFTLALKVFSPPESVSNRTRKDLDGFSAKLHGDVITHFPCYLIGQLARASNVPKDSVSGKDLLNLAFRVIEDSVRVVGGRFILVECRDEKKLTDFYESNQFEKITAISDGGHPMVQMIRKIAES